MSKRLKEIVKNGYKINYQCPWCGRLIDFTPKGLIKRHVNPARRVCVGGGQTKESFFQIKIAQAKRLLAGED